MKLVQKFLMSFFFVSMSFSQIVDVFISDWYIGWRGDGVYNNLVELYNPKEDTVNLADYLFRRTQNGSDWLSTDPDHFIRIAGIIPPGETFAITRAAADPTVVECAYRTYDGGEPAGYVDPDAFLKQNGNDAFGVFYIGGLGDDTTAWIESGTLLDALGNINDNTYWDVSGTPEATRYHILQRKFDVCGGNSGDWNTSRGCVDESCSETSYALSEWEVINCANADPNGANYPEPENQDASADMQVVCGGHQYLCLDAPNSPPGEFALESPVTNSLLNVNSDNVNENLSVSWSESYDPDGHDLHYTFTLYTTFPTEDTLFTASTVNELDLSVSYQSIYDLLGPNNSVNCYWDVFVTDLYDTTATNNGPYFLQLTSDAEGGLNQPPTTFNLESPTDYSLFYLNPNSLDGTSLMEWSESEDPDGNEITYYYLVSLSPNMSDPIGGLWESETNSILASAQATYDYLISTELNESVFYWDVIASDGIFDQGSGNGPFMFYAYIGEDPAENEETYIDLFISDWYIGYRSSPTYNAAVELYNPKEEPIDLSNYILRRTQNGSHWMETSWIRLDGILPPNSTYVLSRAASDLSLQNCADMVEPDEFLKHNGDDGFKITHIGYLPEPLSEDTTAWLKMGLTLDAIGYADNDPGSAWDVSGIPEATRYYILSRNMDVCGGNGGDWDMSRGCVDAACDSTSSELGEWTPIPCALSPSPGDMPEGSDASTDALIFCGNHNYFCSSVSIVDDILPQKIELEQNYPNPFNPTTEISFTMSIQDRAILSIYNIKGQEVATIMDSQMMPGKHTLTWSGKDSMGREISSGMYFYKLTVGELSYQRKLILLR
tara:strand:- start:63 stop:2564 length:2502 start_codon:yes stop_codon:yes gene_type:complete